jgi:hypothetical protein
VWRGQQAGAQTRARSTAGTAHEADNDRSRRAAAIDVQQKLRDYT